MCLCNVCTGGGQDASVRVHATRRVPRVPRQRSNGWCFQPKMRPLWFWLAVITAHTSIAGASSAPSTDAATAKVCTYQDASIKETSCMRLTESKEIITSVKKNQHKHFHLRVEDLSIINQENPTVHIRAAPCSGGVYMWAKTNPFPWPNEFDFRYEANNTEPGSIKQINTRMYNRDYYITIAGYSDTNVSIVAYTSRGRNAAPTRPGEFGYIEAKQEKLTVPMVKIKFRASEWDRNAMYRVYKSLIVEDEGEVDSKNETENQKSMKSESVQKVLPVCQDYWASKPCQVMYTACGIQKFGTPLDDGGFEPKSNGSLVMKVFTGEPGEKYFVNVILQGGNGIMSAYGGAQVFIANAQGRSAVNSDTQILVISIVSSVFGGLALIMAFAWFKLKRAVNMKDPTKKKKKKGTKKNKSTAKEELSKILKGVNPSPSSPSRASEPAASNPKPPPPRPSNDANMANKPSPPPRPAPNQSPANGMNMGTKPPPGPPPKTGGMRIRASKYAVVENTAQEATPKPPPPN